MFLSLSHTLALLEQYKYWVIVPIAVVEGPIVMIISGFLVYLGYLNIYVAYCVLVAADLFGDALHYWVGLYWRRSAWIKKLAGLFGYNENSEKYLAEHFQKYKAKSYLFSKISHGVGGAVQIAAGIARADFYEFLWYCFLGTLLKTLVLLTLGYYVGNYYLKIDDYLDKIAYVTIGLFIIFLIYMATRKYLNKFFVRS